MVAQFVLVTTGDNQPLLHNVEMQFRIHLQHHGDVVCKHLGKVDSLYHAYFDAAADCENDSAILLFVHQDVLPAFSPEHPASPELVQSISAQASWLGKALQFPDGWVQQLISLSGDEDAGFFGVAGATSLHAGNAWWNEKEVHGAVIHLGAAGEVGFNAYGPFGRVAVLDGLFLAARKSLFDQLERDKRVEGFHFYDMELCLQAHLAGKKNWCLPLVLTHRSGGELVTDEGWLEAAKQFEERHASVLPLEVGFEGLKG